MTGGYHACPGCGREIPEVSDECADCLTGDREPTLSDFAKGEVSGKEGRQ